jgi:hypothetical protein
MHARWSEGKEDACLCFLAGIAKPANVLSARPSISLSVSLSLSLSLSLSVGLEQLPETRSAGSVWRPTLMHYVIDLVESSFPDCARFAEDLSHVPDGHKSTYTDRHRDRESHVPDSDKRTYTERDRDREREGRCAGL